MWHFGCRRAQAPTLSLQPFGAKGGDLLQKSYLFDEFTKGEKTSLAFRLVFQSFERTLEDKEVNAIMEKVSAAFRSQGFEIR